MSVGEQSAAEPDVAEPGVAGLTVAAAQPVTVSDDLAGNARRHAALVTQADARLVVFPELSLTGYHLEVAAVGPEDPALLPLVEACDAAGSVALVGAPVSEAGRRSIAMLWVDATGVRIAYRKRWLGGDEADRFSPGDGTTVLELDGWRVGVGICRDTGTDDHVAAMIDATADVYVAGLVHHPDELREQDRRGERLAREGSMAVAFASFAGPTGGGFDTTAGHSTVWAAGGAQLARADARPGGFVRAMLHR